MSATGKGAPVDLQAYLRALRKSWWLIVLAAILGAGGGLLYSARTTPQYQSSVTFYVSTPSEAAGGSAYQANQYALSRIASYEQLLSSERLGKMIVDKTKVSLSARSVAGLISASSDINTVLLRATVTDTSPQRSLAIADAIATEFGTMVDELDNRTAGADASGSTVVLNVVSGPTLNPNPVVPKTKTNMILGFVAGLVVGVVLALLRALLDTTIRGADQVRTLTGRPVLAALWYDAQVKKAPLLVGDALRSIRAESYRQLRTNLQFVDVDNPVQVLVVTSSVPNEGKTTVATNLALVYAEAGQRVLLVEADMRRPQIAELLGLERAIGLSNVLAGQLELTEALQPWGSDELTVLLSGSIPPNPSELLGSDHMDQLLADLRLLFDVIILDTPPLLPVTDAAVSAAKSDGVLVVVRQGKTSRNQLQTAVETLDAVDARVLGLVLSMGRRKYSGGSTAYRRYELDSTASVRHRRWTLRKSAPVMSPPVRPQNEPVGVTGTVESTTPAGRMHFRADGPEDLNRDNIEGQDGNPVVPGDSAVPADTPR